jgi:hypothetical protein
VRWPGFLGSVAIEMNFEHRLEFHVPPGVNLRQELNWLVYGGVAGLLYSLKFLIHYAKNYERLFLRDGMSKVLNTRAVMPDFMEILGSSLGGFLILALCMGAVAIYHYAYHYEGSKSIYLMKRLPNRRELPRRCITLPLLGTLACLCASLFLLFIYFAVYMAFTPPACLTPHQWQKIWSVLLGVLV